MHRNTKLYWSVAIGALIVIISGIILLYNKLHISDYQPYKHIPKEASAVLEFQKSEDIFRLWQNEDSYKHLIKIQPLLQDSTSSFALLVRTLKQIEAFDTEQPGKTLIAALSANAYLAVMPAENISLTQLQQHLGKYAITDNTHNRTFAIAQKQDSLYISIDKGALIASNQWKNHTNSATSQQRTHQYWQSVDFEKIKEISGKRAAVHLFTYFPASEPQTSHSIDLWMQNMGLECYTEGNGLIMNGYADVYDSVNILGTLLKGQSSSGFLIPNQLPYNTIGYAHFSLSSYPDYRQQWENFGKQFYTKKAYEKWVNISQKRSKIGAYTAKWWAGEMTLSISKDKAVFAVFRAKQGRTATAALAAVSKTVKHYNDIPIKKLTHTYFLPKVFGPWFTDFKQAYYAIVHEWVVFAKDIPSLKAYLEALTKGNTLQKNITYQHYAQNISTSNSVTIYNPQHQNINNYLSVFGQLPYISSAQQASMHFNWQNNRLYTAFYCDFSKSTAHTPLSKQTATTQNISTWQSETKGHIVAAPILVHNARDASQYMVYDEFNTLYMMNGDGNIVWDMDLPQNIIGHVQELRHRGKYYYAFATAKQIYLIDSEGNIANGFPVVLESDATTGLSVIQYNTKSAPLLMLATDNGQIYAYNIKGESAKNWHSKATRRHITKDIYHVKSGKRDYIIAEADNHNVLMFDKQGKTRLEIRTSFKNALGSDFYENKTNSRKGFLLSTDTQGKLTYVPRKGKVKQTDFGTFSPQHFFLYLDIDKNRHPDFIYLDGKALTVFNKFKKVLFSYQFDNPIHQKPQYFSHKGQIYLAVFDEIAKQVYLFNKKGFTGKKIQSDTPVLYHKKGNKAYLLLTRKKALVKTGV